jgi:hypothetical protein
MTRARTPKGLPKTVFIARQFSDSGHQSWLSAQTDVTYLAELGEVIQVGRYQLVDIAPLNGVPLLGKPARVKQP